MSAMLEDADKVGREAEAFILVKDRTPSVLLPWMQQGLSSRDERQGFFDTTPKASSPVHRVPSLPSGRVTDTLLNVYLAQFNTITPIFHDTELRDQVRRVQNKSSKDVTEYDVFVVLSEFNP
jgi:hypothetical protein